MAWTPTYSIVTPETIPDNLFAWILDGTRQRDALTWADGATLKLIKSQAATIANRLKPIYPSMAFIEDNDVADHTGDLIEAAYSVTIEVSIQNANPDTALSQAKTYRKALKSLIRNCLDSDLLINTGVTSATLATIEGGFDPIRSNEKQNDFLQVFQLRMTYSPMVGAF